MKTDALLRPVKKQGWYEVRQKGSHKILKHDEVKDIIILPYHGGKEVPKSLANKILKQAGLR